MKKLFSIFGLAAAAAFAWAGSANAADMPVKAPPAPVVAAYDWSGLYVGFHDGYEWASVHDTQVNNGYVEDSKVRNSIVGFHVGLQKQFGGAPWGAWVVGVEGGLNEPMNRNSLSNFGFCSNPTYLCGISNFQSNWYAGGRLGLAFNLASGGWLFGGDYLITVSGGWTNAVFHRQGFNAATGLAFGCNCDSIARHDGGYVGVGLEHVWAKGNLVDWISGVDYMHEFYGNQTDIDTAGVGHTLSADVDIIRLRTTLKFK